MKQRTKYSSGGFIGTQPTMPAEAAAIVTDILGAEYIGTVQEICQMYLCMKEEIPDLKNNDNLKAVAEAAKNLLNALDRLSIHDEGHIIETGNALSLRTVKTIVERLTEVGPKRGMAEKPDEPGRLLVTQLADLYLRIYGKRPTRITEYISSTSATTSTPIDPILKALDPYIHCGTCAGHLKEIL